MNKQELIEKYQYKLYEVCTNYGEYYRTIAYENILKDLEQLDEPQKVTIPQFVADWIEECKNDDFHLFGAMEGISSNQKKLDYWFREDDNMEIFARAWLDGYEVEKEKWYTVKMRATKQPLFYNNMYEKIFFSLGELATRFTRKELEEAGFGWVFNCPGVEVKEMKE